MGRRTPKAAPAPSKPMHITQSMIERFAQELPQEFRREFTIPQLPPGVLPKGANSALDSAIPTLTWLNNQSGYCGLGFPGYTYLAELSQRSEFQAPTETIAGELTRTWIDLQGADDKKLKELKTATETFNVRGLLRRMSELDGFFGRGQIYVGIKGQESDQRRQLPLLYGPENIAKGSLRILKAIEPVWTTPYMYNAIDPTQEDFYKPRAWYVLGKKTDASRLLTFVGRPLPDILKPAYNFGGLSLSQLVEPYVNRWLKTVDSVNRLISNFSISGIKTNMMAALDGGDTGDQLIRRAQLYSSMRDNRGVMLLDKESEDFFQYNTPLSGLPDLQAQAQEHMAAPTHIPLIKLTGITPSGLNASSEGELTVFYEFCNATRQNFYDPHLKNILKILQCHLWGEIDEDITYSWCALDEPSQKELAKMRADDAQAAGTYLDKGVITEDDQRVRLINDPNSGYNFLTGKAPGVKLPPTTGLPGANSGNPRQEPKPGASNKQKES